jgi:predicted Fe-Mo cluster-binding NifX family protein
VRSVVGRNAGRFRFIQARIALRTQDLDKAHAASHRIEQRIRDQVPHVERVVIHYEPARPEQYRAALPLQDAEGALSPHFGGAPFFRLCTLDPATLQPREQDTLVNKFADLERGKGIKVAEWLVGLGVDVVLLQEDVRQKGPGYVLANAGVDVRVLREDTVRDMLERYAREQDAETPAE